MGVEWWPVHGLIALSAGPGGVPTTVTETGLVADENFAGTEAVTVGASARRVGDPLSCRGLHELAQHDDKPSSVRCLSRVF